MFVISGLPIDVGTAPATVIELRDDGPNRVPGRGPSAAAWAFATATFGSNERLTLGVFDFDSRLVGVPGRRDRLVSSATPPFSEDTLHMSSSSGNPIHFHWNGLHEQVHRLSQTGYLNMNNLIDFD